MNTAHDLTDSRVHYNIKRIALPAAIGFFGHTLYNMTDTFYAGYINTAAQSALTFSFPLYFLLLSCCVGLGQALTARIANAIGKKRYARAAYFLAQGIILSSIICLLIWLFLLPATSSIVTALGGSGDAAAWATEYSRIIYLGSPLFLYAFMFNSALQAAGNATAFKNSVIASVLLNIVLDPILMFGWLGLPAMGVAGVALATLLSQFVGGVYLFTVLNKTIVMHRWRWLFLRPRVEILLKLIKQATAPTGRMIGIGLFFFLVTAFLGRLDNDAVAAYGIAIRIEQLFLLPTIGLEVALLSYAGQNLAAGKPQQTRTAYLLCLRYGIICMIIGAIFLVGVGKYFIQFFNDDEVVVEYGYNYLLVAACVGNLYLFINLGGAVLMGALKTFDIFITSLLRLLILPIIFFWILAIQLELGVIGVWIGILLANIPAALWMHYRCIAVLAK